MYFSKYHTKKSVGSSFRFVSCCRKRQNAPYAPFFCSADSGQAVERQGYCGQQEEADLVAGRVLEAHGQKVAGPGAGRERQ